MTLDIMTPEKKLYSGEVTFVHLPGISGQFELMNNHAPIISALGQGLVTIKDTSGSKNFNITGGFVECLNNKVIICAEGVVAE